MYKTNKTHFSIFKKECKRLVKLWGLTSWRVEFEHGDLSYVGQDVAAACSIDMLQHAITLSLATEWNEPVTTELLKRDARHEMIHALLAPIAHICNMRWVSENEYMTASHETLELLMKLLPG